MEAMHVDTKGPTAKGAVVEEQKKVWLRFSNTGLMIVLDECKSQKTRNACVPRCNKFNSFRISMCSRRADSHLSIESWTRQTTDDSRERMSHMGL